MSGRLGLEPLVPRVIDRSTARDTPEPSGASSGMLLSISGADARSDVEVLTSRVLLRATDPARSRAFYRDVLGLAVAREFGPADSPGVVFFLGGGGLLEISGHGGEPPRGLALWLQVRDVEGQHRRLLAARVRVVRAPRTEPWGLVEMWIEDPDGVGIVLVQVPADHPLRRDRRGLEG